ncbi:hypothetical protein TIFTF001_028540 [Ficus carica]|uniref:PRISE-like Rossmann-fold domain-containing protein n=1 Tax=Ficus carica TaxID=3494 RepID=A0AA88DRC8_FICCA|nr:hypothetical protein TIFTF001_028540 [Ficus carica]
MAGLSLAEALKSPEALGGPWKVYGAARQQKPPWFPSSDAVDHFMSFDALSSNDTFQKLSPISDQVTHLFWVAIQHRDTEESNIAANAAMLRNVLEALKSPNHYSKLQHVTLQTGTKHYMGLIFDPILGATKLVHHDTPFQEDEPRLPYPNFYYRLEDVLDEYKESMSFTSSVHRSSIIFGASSRSLHNMLSTLCVYASVCRQDNLPFRYPGTAYTWEHFCDATDARVLAQQHIWAAVTDKAKGQAFNCTNGDVFTWRSLWKVMCEIFGLEFVPFEEEDREFDWVGTMKEKGSVWEEIVERHGLCKTKMEEIACFEVVKTVLCLEFQHVCSVNKSREYGFLGYANTLKSVKMWVGRLRDMKIIP